MKAIENAKDHMMRMSSAPQIRRMQKRVIQRSMTKKPAIATKTMEMIAASAPRLLEGPLEGSDAISKGKLTDLRRLGAVVALLRMILVRTIYPESRRP